MLHSFQRDNKIKYKRVIKTLENVIFSRVFLYIVICGKSIDYCEIVSVTGNVFYSVTIIC